MSPWAGPSSTYRSPWNGRVSEVTFVALGSNVGDRAAYLAAARCAITLIGGVMLLAASRIEETAPLGALAQGPYLNQMIAIATTLEPPMLLEHLQMIERGLGRVRRARWSARTIDLDIVRFGARTLESTALTLPHRGLANRDFWRREVQELEHLVGTAA